MSGVCSVSRSISARQRAIKSKPLIVLQSGGSSISTRILLVSLPYDKAATRLPSASSDTRKKDPMVVIIPINRFTMPISIGIIV